MHAPNGAPRETRTPDPLITNQMLYQLSYRGSIGMGRALSYLGQLRKIPFYFLCSAPFAAAKAILRLIQYASWMT